VKRGVPIYIALWAVAVAAGFILLERYANAAGRGAHAPSRLNTSLSEASLKVFIHPECPCSRASLAELARLQSSWGEKLDTVVEVFAPDSMPKSWSQGDLYHQAINIPHVKVELDRNGNMARNFHVFTSGQVLLYSKDGCLVFSGGLTASRGHEGENAGTDAINSYLKTGRVPVSTTPVFGCAIGAN